MVATDQEITVYALGLCYASVCALKHATIEEVERAVNLSDPTGLDHGWHHASESFDTGETNPCACNSDPERLHWLLSC